MYKKVKSKSNIDIYFTNPEWKTKVIDDVEFISVVKFIHETSNKSSQKFWMRKENVDIID